MSDTDTTMNFIPGLSGNFVSKIAELFCNEDVKVVVECNKEFFTFFGTLVQVNCDSIQLDDAEAFLDNFKQAGKADVLFDKVVIPLSRVCFIGTEARKKC
ncbi:MAG: hypothetical protein A4E53_03233 [Pelotomaculum sp. PtaB.Bin104]|nr:MAG: hypothetical protein A4E53_03233 [Pelotomaculum sp. PtaB.Bin104]